ncbi:hypothetical protein B484DRAFT_460484, partial [Ochromonadaceae sp. CCMP2298]
MLVGYEEELQAQGYSWADMEMWKIDVNGAYTLQENAPDACKLYLSQLSDDGKQLVIMYTCGGFGSCFQPAAFDVVTRAGRHELPRLIHGFGHGYVDDFFGAALRWLCAADMEAVKGFFRALLGPDITRDRGAQRVTLSAKCLEKALHGLMSVNEFEPMPIKVVQRMASWGVRYGAICPIMHPFTSVLYNELRGRSHKYSTITLSPLARVAVHMLRALTLLMGVDEPDFSRPFDSWVPPARKTGIMVELDGSLSGLGLLFFAASVDGSEHLVGVSEVDVRCLGFGEDSGWQNVCEYIATTAATKGASILSKRGLLVDGKPPQGVWMRGDSFTALTWAEKGRDHLFAVLNKRADKIFRRAEGTLSLRELVDSDPGMAGAEIIDLHMEQEVLLSDPMRRLDTP